MSVEDPKFDPDIMMSDTIEKKDIKDLSNDKDTFNSKGEDTVKNLNLLSNEIIANINENSNSEKNVILNNEFISKSDTLINGDNIDTLNVLIGEPLKNPVEAKELMLLNSDKVLIDPVSDNAIVNELKNPVGGVNTAYVDNLNDTITDKTLSKPSNMVVVTCSIAPTELKQSQNDLVKSTMSTLDNTETHPKKENDLTCTNVQPPLCDTKIAILDNDKYSTATENPSIFIDKSTTQKLELNTKVPDLKFIDDSHDLDNKSDVNKNTTKNENFISKKLELLSKEGDEKHSDRSFCHMSNDSLFAPETDQSGEMLNITESSSDELLDDSTFLPSESLLFTPEKFDRTDEDLDTGSAMNLRLSPFSTAPTSPQPTDGSSGAALYASGCGGRRSTPLTQTTTSTNSTRPRIYSDTTGRLGRLKPSGTPTSPFLNSGHSSIPSRNRSSATGRSTESIPGGSDDSWQPSSAAASAAPLSLPAALSGAGSKSYDYLLKVLLVGDSDVGKQEIITGMEDGSMDSPYTSSTGGAAYKTTIILIDGKKVKLHIWDTSGQGRFCTIIRSYSRGAQGILLVYDITNRWSFEGIDRWVREVEEHAPGIPKVLVGNRLHLAFKRQVDPLEAETYAQKHNMGFYEISPLVNFNITESFQELCRMALKRNGMERLWRGNRVLSLHEMCCHAIVNNTNVYGIDKLPLPEGVKANLKSYAMTSYPVNRHTFKSWKERKKKLRKEENAAKISNCVNATRKSCTIS